MAKKSSKVLRESIPVALDEIRLAYQVQTSLFDSIENKASYILAFNGVAVAFMAVVFLSDLIWFLPVFVLSLVSIYYAFKVLEPQRALRPHGKFDDWFKHTHIPVSNCQKQLIINYIEVCNKEEENNKKKLVYLQRSVLFVKYLLILFILVLLTKYAIFDVLKTLFNL